MKAKKLFTLAEKGSLKDFTIYLEDYPRPIPDEVLFSAIRIALAWNHPEKVQLLLHAGADPLATNEENAQLLSHAAISGGGELVTLMLTLGCDVNHRNIYNRTALHEAARFGNREGIRVLLKAGADLDCRDVHNQTPLLEAISNNKLEVAMQLIRSGADVHKCLSMQEETPLMLAASRGAVPLVRLLLKKGNGIESRDFIGCTPLMHAARSGTPEVVQLLLNAGADRDARDKNGKNALQWASSLKPEIAMLLLGQESMSPALAREALLKAATDGNIRMIRILLEKKARIQPRKEGGESALVTAVFRKSLEAFQLLLQHRSANINYRHGKALRTPLIVAAHIGDIAKVRLLLESGADLTITDIDAQNAFNHAAISSYKDILALLHEYGAVLDNRDLAGRTLLHQAIYGTESFAVGSSRTETARWLLDHDSDPNSVDNAGRTPLMLAAANAYEDIAAMLMKAGASINVQDEEGRNALVHALYYGTEYGYNERYSRPKSEETDKAAPVIRMLLEAGADPNRGDALVHATKWRWPGAAGLLKHFSAEEIKKLKR